MQLFEPSRLARAARATRSSCAQAVAVLLIAVAPVGAALADEDDDETYAIGLWGDMPYSDAQALVGVPNLIADMPT